MNLLRNLIFSICFLVPIVSLGSSENQHLANTWLSEQSDDFVFVFVHGFNSNANDAWLHSSESSSNKLNVYWPELVENDVNLGKPSIFLGGYYSDITGKGYKIRDASEELYTALRNSRTSSGKKLLHFKNVVFVAHSLGGIVVRDILSRHTDKFINHNIGLFLVASPSLGSDVAERLRIFNLAFNSDIANALRPNSDYLDLVHEEFKNILEQDLLHLTGQEIAEHEPTFFGLGKIVTKLSSTVYFSDSVTIPKSNHLSIAKPDSTNHRSHATLVDFYLNKYLSLVSKRFADELSELEEDYKALHEFWTVHHHNPNKYSDIFSKAVALKEKIQINYPHGNDSEIYLQDLISAIYLVMADVSSDEEIKSLMLDRLIEMSSSILEKIDAIKERSIHDPNRYSARINAIETNELVERARYHVAIGWTIKGLVAHLQDSNDEKRAHWDNANKFITMLKLENIEYWTEISPDTQRYFCQMQNIQQNGSKTCPTLNVTY